MAEPYLSVEDIEASALLERDFEVPEWGGTIRIKAISQQDYLEIIAEVGRDEGGRPADAQRAGLLMVIKAVVEPKLSEEALMRQPLGLVGRLAKVVSIHSGVDEEAFKSG